MIVGLHPDEGEEPELVDAALRPLADVDRHEPLEYVQEQKTAEEPQTGVAAEQLDRLGEHVEEDGADHEPGGDREQVREPGAVVAVPPERNEAARDRRDEDQRRVEDYASGLHLSFFRQKRGCVAMPR